MTDSDGDAASWPPEAEREHRSRLADAIERRLQVIEHRWLDRVEAEVVDSGHHIEPTALRDAIGEYLASLAKALHGEGSVESGGTTAWADVAREHALTRVRQGFDVGQLVREFILLRRVLFEVIREEDLLSSDRRGEHLADLVEAAIATSVRSYVESRDVAERRSQAEHIGFVTHELRNPLS